MTNQGRLLSPRKLYVSLPGRSSVSTTSEPVPPPALLFTFVLFFFLSFLVFFLHPPSKTHQALIEASDWPLGLSGAGLARNAESERSRTGRSCSSGGALIGSPSVRRGRGWNVGELSVPEILGSGGPPLPSAASATDSLTPKKKHGDGQARGSSAPLRPSCPSGPRERNLWRCTSAAGRQPPSPSFESDRRTHRAAGSEKAGCGPAGRGSRSVARRYLQASRVGLVRALRGVNGARVSAWRLGKFTAKIADFPRAAAKGQARVENGQARGGSPRAGSAAAGRCSRRPGASGALSVSGEAHRNSEKKFLMGDTLSA